MAETAHMLYFKKKGVKMLYKLAAVKHTIDPAKEHELAEERARIHTLNRVFLPSAPGMDGFLNGKEIGHPAVGIILGPIGVNGARAKDTGISTFGTTVRAAGKYNAIGGGLVGAVLGAAIGRSKEGFKGALKGGLKGSLIGTTIGLVEGPIEASLKYGLGYAFGKKQKHPKKVDKVQTII